VLIPLFKSHFSIGKSILTLSAPKSEGAEDSSDSVFDIALNNNLEKVFLVEDSFMGFLQARKVCSDLSKQLIFGIRLDFCEDASNIEDSKSVKCSHKIIIFPKNSDGCKDLNKIYTLAKTKYKGWLDLNILKKHWNENNLSLAIPFYDSFLFNNLTTFQSCFVNFSFTNPTFFTESNDLPFDSIINQSVKNYCDKNNLETQAVQSIYYKDKKDFSAYLTYKLICGRSSFAGRELSLEKPNFDHLGSDQFCWESYMEKL
jgi:DNA polymerase III alpha subunit